MDSDSTGLQPVSSSDHQGRALAREDDVREPSLPRHLVQWASSRQGFASIGLASYWLYALLPTWSYAPTTIVAYGIVGLSAALILGGSYRMFSFVRRMALPPRQGGLTAGASEARTALPHALRPLAHELRVLLATLESLFATMRQGFHLYGPGTRDDTAGHEQAFLSAMSDLGAWISGFEALDVQAREEALARGASLHALRGLLTAQLEAPSDAPDGMALAVGLKVRARRRTGWFARFRARRDGLWGWSTPFVDRKVVQRTRQLRHFRRVLLELRRIEDALHQHAQHPYR